MKGRPFTCCGPIKLIEMDKNNITCIVNFPIIPSVYEHTTNQLIISIIPFPRILFTFKVKKEYKTCLNCAHMQEMLLMLIISNYIFFLILIKHYKNAVYVINIRKKFILFTFLETIFIVTTFLRKIYHKDFTAKR